MARQTAYNWREADKGFAAAWDAACDVAWDRAEREAYRRAVEGWDEPVYQGGVQVGVVRRYSDTMLQATLKAKRAKEWRESMKHDVELSGDIRLSMKSILPPKARES